MERAMRRNPAILAIWATVIAGCGTFSDRLCGPADDHLYYRGVRLDLAAIKEGGAKTFLATDIPLSALADTVQAPWIAIDQAFADVIPPQNQTDLKLCETYARIETFWNQHGRVPAKVDDLPEVKDRDCSMKDGWGRELHWVSDGATKVTVQSLGRDGKPGGTGGDADLEIVFVGTQKEQHDVPTIRRSDEPQ
jgi:uncharacterized protein YceK